MLKSIKKLVRPLTRKVKLVIRYFKYEQASKNIRLYNYVVPPAPQDFWLAQFIEAKNLLPRNKKLTIFSVFGSRTMIKLFNRAEYKIFTARENLHREHWQHYNDLLLNEKWVDLVVGFDYLTKENYIRFPLWLMWIFKPTDTYEDIKHTCRQINNIENASFNRKFCAFLSSHNDIGRREIYEELSAIDKVDCDGRLFHNNDDLKTKLADDKLAYLRNYRFNLCPENSNAEGYCTEKLFEAIVAGCTPIYWGSGQRPEPDVVNQNAILFAKMGDDNKNLIAQIKYLNENEKAYLEFARQPRLNENAADVIWNYFCNLEIKLKEIIK